MSQLINEKSTEHFDQKRSQPIPGQTVQTGDSTTNVNAETRTK